MSGNEKNAGADENPIRILLIEDEPAQAVLVREMLKEMGVAFSLEHANRLAGGLEWLDRAPFDIVLLDLGLPDSFGLETVEQARARAGEIPIVVLSGQKDQEIARQTLQCGAQDYLIKGQFDIDLLVECLRHVLRRFGLREKASSDGS